MKNLIKQSFVIAVFLLGSLGLMAQEKGEVTKMLQNDEKKEQVFNSIVEDPDLRKEMMQRLEVDGEKKSGCCDMDGMMMEKGEMQGMKMDMSNEDSGMCKMCKMMMGDGKMMNMKGNSDDQHKMQGMKGMNMQHQEKNSATVDITNEPAFLVSYTNIKNALVNDNYEQVKKAASKMKKSLGNSGLKRQQRNEIAASLDQLTESGDIKTQRKHFAQLSQNLYQVLKNNDITDKALYLQNCGMAMGGQGGSWLSYEEQVRNPYMGQRMPGCGSVEEKVGN